MTLAFERKPIKVVHSTQTVVRKIEHADERMIVREFMQNALEASEAAGPLARVKWHAFEEGDVPKLYVWNNGRGMSPDELQDRMNLFVSGTEKQQAIDKNYGIGAKLTGLKASPDGVLFRSCKDGAVTQLLIGYDEEGIPSMLELEDVTDIYSNWHLKEWDLELYRKMGKEQCTLCDFEWTMAVFLGRDEDQNTVIDPFGEAIKYEEGQWKFPKGKPVGGQDYWLMKAINRRYYDLSQCCVSAIVMPSTARQNRFCHGAKDLKVDQQEYVSTGYGQIRYVLMPDGAGNEDAYGTTARGILVFRNEIYSGYFGEGLGGWRQFAPQVGISAGHRRIAIDVLLNDEFPASPNEYRTALEQSLGRGSRQVISFDDFAEDIELYMPEFLREFIRAEESKNDRCSDRVDRAGREMMVELGLKDPGSKDGTDDQISRQEGDGDARVITKRTRPEKPREPENSDTERDHIQRKHKKRPFRRGKPVETSARKNLSHQPQVQWKNEGATFGEIGSYNPKTKIIELFREHPVLEAVIREMLSRGIAETHRQTIAGYAEDQIGIAAVAHVLWATKLLQTDEWDEARFLTATSPESLTASLGYYKRHMPAVADMCRSIKRDKTAK